MKVFCVHPSGLMYSKIFLRLEPLGLELVAQAVRQAGHTVRLTDLQVESHADYFRHLDSWQPDVVAFSCNYLANVPEIIDLAAATRKRLPGVYIFVGGHSASFIAREILDHAAGAIDCVLTGEGEAAAPLLLETLSQDRGAVDLVPGAVTLSGTGPPPTPLRCLEDIFPARDLLRKRRKYFIGVLDPCASIEFSRGCPWDCAFCSAWTFYGRTHRFVNPEIVADEMERIEERGIFIVDDVAFVHAGHAMAIGEEILRRGIKKHFYVETRGDVLLRNREVFEFWAKLGLKYMFVGLEAIDEEGLAKYRKRTTQGENFEALELARSLGIEVAVNIIADPDWDKRRFEIVRQWCMESPEIVNISVNTPYPGTETWLTEARRIATRDYRLFDIQHAVLTTRLPLNSFYEELVKTQLILHKKHLGWAALKGAAKIAAGHLLRGQTNFIKMLWKFNSVYDPALQLSDHRQPVKYEISLPPATTGKLVRTSLYVLRPERKQESRKGKLQG